MTIIPIFVNLEFGASVDKAIKDHVRSANKHYI